MPGTQIQNPGTTQPGAAQTPGTTQPGTQTQAPGTVQDGREAAPGTKPALTPAQRIENLTAAIKKSGLTTRKATIAAQTLYQTAQQYGPNAEAMLNTYQPGQNPKRFASGFQNAFILGTQGNQEALEKSKAAAYLTSEQRERAYEMGTETAKQNPETMGDDRVTGDSTEEGKELKYRLKDDESVFCTYDERPVSKGRDVIKPRNIMKEMKKSQIGTELLNYLEQNNVRVVMHYGKSGERGRMGQFEAGEIYIFPDNTRTVYETTLTVIHEATHARINKPNTKNQELECFKNEYRHKGVELTEEVIHDIVKYIDEKYDYIDWE